MSHTQIDISLSSTLNDLKDAISTEFSPIKRTEQRLFYLGRELKSENRTLSALGVGNFNVFSIHLHSLAPKMVDLLGDDHQEGDAKQKSSSSSVSTNNSRRKKNNATTAEVVDLAGSSPSGQRNSRQQQQQNQQQQEKVVELLDSDSDSDDDIVEVVDTKRQRRD